MLDNDKSFGDLKRQGGTSVISYEFDNYRRKVQIKSYKVRSYPVYIYN